MCAMCVNACGKLPSASPVLGVDLLGEQPDVVGAARRARRAAPRPPSRRPECVRQSSSQNEHSRNAPSPPRRPSRREVAVDERRPSPSCDAHHARSCSATSGSVVGRKPIAGTSSADASGASVADGLREPAVASSRRRAGSRGARRARVVHASTGRSAACALARAAPRGRARPSSSASSGRSGAARRGSPRSPGRARASARTTMSASPARKFQLSGVSSSAGLARTGTRPRRAGRSSRAAAASPRRCRSAPDASRGARRGASSSSSGSDRSPRDAVHDLQVLAAARARALQPELERLGLLAEAEREQRDERERGVADPRVAVVPVALAADRPRAATSSARRPPRRSARRSAPSATSAERRTARARPRRR